MATLEKWFFQCLSILMVCLLSAMAVMVFGNVVLRYVFNSGLDMADELSRFSFIWLTFLGSVIAVREGGHLGVDFVIQKVPPSWQAGFAVLSHVLMIACCAIFFWGLWQQHDINMSNTALITGIPFGFVYGVAFFSCTVMALILAARLYRFFSGRITLQALIALGSAD